MIQDNTEVKILPTSPEAKIITSLEQKGIKRIQEEIILMSNRVRKEG